MNILLACEESQRVCEAFRKRGHNAFSCDLLECSGEHPEWHIQGDVIPVLNGKCSFITMDNQEHFIDSNWDMIIAFPPCTFLTNSGNRWFNIEKYGEKAIKRWEEREKALEFVKTIWNSECEKLVIENPIGYLNSHFQKPTQIIHPYYFAEFQDDENCERKSTCLWIRGVEPLQYEIKFKPRIVQCKNGSTDCAWHMETWKLPKEQRSIVRSKTYPGVAKAMSEQWG